MFKLPVQRFCSQLAAKCREIVVVKRFTQEDLDKFTQLTGDYNPIHSIEYPASERMVHGALLNAVVAGLIGTQLPGPGTIVLEQRFTFPKPCRINENTEIKLTLLKERRVAEVAYECKQGNHIVFQGEAKLLIKPIAK